MGKINKEFGIDEEYLEYLRSIPVDVYIKILENCSSDVYVMDKEGKIIYVNPNSIRHYGVDPKEMIGQNNYSFRKGKWTPTALEKCVGEKRTVFAEQNYLLIGKSVSTVLTPIFDKDGEIEMVVTIANEIPEKYDMTWRKLDGEKSKAGSRSKTHTIEAEDGKDDDEIVGQSYIFCKILLTIKKVSESDVPILLTGESGVGKTLIAEYVHKTSLRASKPFWAITVPRYRKTFWNRNYSVMRPMPLQEPAPRGRSALWNWPMVARCSLMKSVRWPRGFRPSCWTFWKTSALSRWAEVK